MLSLYIHIPFCVRKCLYCGFYSTQYSPSLADEYVCGLNQEAAYYKDAFKDRTFESIYIGGGTPTTLSQDQLARVMDGIIDNFRISEAAEFTIEANPNALSGDLLPFLIARGVSRLSLGVQSFSDSVLGTLGRTHSANDAFGAIGLVGKAGLENISIDLIYGVPGQTMEDWIDTLNKAIALRPRHISAYGLSLDENAVFSREAAAGRLALLDDDVVIEMYERGCASLNEAGYGRYEISNFALPGFECRHNLNYWERGEYLGLGPSAWTFISNRRYYNIADLRDYSRRLGQGLSPVAEEDMVSNEQAATEALMLGLRTTRGLELSRYEQEFGQESIDKLASRAAGLRAEGFLNMSKGRLRLTERGLLLSNEVLARLSS